MMIHHYLTQRKLYLTLIQISPDLFVTKFHAKLSIKVNSEQIRSDDRVEKVVQKLTEERKNAKEIIQMVSSTDNTYVL